MLYDDDLVQSKSSFISPAGQTDSQMIKKH